MEVIINELSLSGQFKDKDEFLDNLNELLPIIKLISELNFYILKNYLFYNSKITSEQTLHQIVCTRDSRVRRLKSHLIKLTDNPPYWNDSPKHSCKNDTYTHNSNDICDTSLAETSQRDKFLLSFKHDDYLDKNLVIQKNSNDMTIFNIVDKVRFLDRLYEDRKINPLTFCLHKFSNSNINFTKLEENYGFDMLNTTQTIGFINTFNNFSLMNWDNINNSDGFEYKHYSGNWFGNNYQDKNIHKFRVSQKYRCFGYRKDDVFYVLRFETDHKISNNG